MIIFNCLEIFKNFFLEIRLGFIFLVISGLLLECVFKINIYMMLYFLEDLMLELIMKYISVIFFFIVFYFVG